MEIQEVVMVERSRERDADVLNRPGKRSVQIVSVDSAFDAKATVTRVTLEPGAVSPRHSHQCSEQIWLVEQGRARLLLADGSEQMVPGDVVRTRAGEVHGIDNDGGAQFVYLTVTCPPEDMAGFYDDPGEPATDPRGEHQGNLHP